MSLAEEFVDDMPTEEITLYFWPTPNGFKISIMLEEIGLPYKLHYVDINAGAQHEPSYLAISPNNRIPAIVDDEGPDGRAMSLFESGAILQYLGRKYETLYPVTERRKADVDQWLFWQVGGLGPMSGQALHFRKYAKEEVPYAITRYTNEVARLFGVMERGLAERDYLAVEYSIADIACFPWVRRHEDLGIDLGQFPKLKAWYERIAARPAVIRGLEVGRDPAARVNV